MPENSTVLVTAARAAAAAQDGSYVLLDIETETEPLTLALPFSELVKVIKALTYAHGDCLKAKASRPG
jgi:hypothetical protein